MYFHTSTRLLQTMTGLALLAFPITLQAGPLRMDIYSLIRAARWKEVRSHYNQKAPSRAIEHYAMGNALLKDAGKKRGGAMPREAAYAIGNFVTAMGYRCDKPTTQSAVLHCLSKATARRTSIARLSIQKAAETAGKYRWFQVEHRLLALTDFRVNDPLSASIMADYLKSLDRHNSPTALQQARRFKQLSGPMLDLQRARIMLKAGKKDEAFHYLVRSAQSTEAFWIEKAILVEVRRHYPALIKAPSGPRMRLLTAFSPAMQSSEIKALNKLATATILKSTTADRLRNDGIFLVKAGRGHQLNLLSNKGYSRLHQRPDIMYSWALELKKARAPRSQLIALLKKNHSIMSQHAGLFQIYLDALQAAGMRQAYFQETLKYLKKYPSHYSVQDHLITFLIGDDPDNIRWAHDSYWRRAMDNLPRHTGSGRFVYWLSRYFEHSKNQAGVQRLNNHHYRLAPGSFYAGAFWDAQAKKPQSNFMHDWQRVRNRQDYLEWLSRHGGNPAALKFLKRRSRLSLLDPDAVRLWKDAQSSRHQVPERILTIFRVGEWRLGHASLLDQHGGRLQSHDNLARLSYVGRATGALDYSVYYTRQFARARGVAEDPYGMPGGLLHTLYPRPYRATVIKHARTYGVKESQVYALMRQESLFREHAISRSGAQGLMQIMPRTGAWLAGKMGLRNPDYMHPSTNIQLGAKYFADLIQQTGDFRWASIAYNGGPGNLRRWKKQYYSGDFYHFLEHLPKEESRNYCRITYQNYMHYETTYTLYP